MEPKGTVRRRQTTDSIEAEARRGMAPRREWVDLFCVRARVLRLLAGTWLITLNGGGIRRA
jgi:hypothetical protein